MRAVLAFAFRRSAARLVLGVAILGGLWTGLERAYPWGPHTSPPAEPMWLGPIATTPWDVRAAIAVVVLALVPAVLLYRRHPTSR